MKRCSKKRIAEILLICIILSLFILCCERQDKSGVQTPQEKPPSTIGTPKVQPTPSLNNNSFNSKEICLAGLATVMAWAESPTGGQSEFGDYDSDEGSNHIYKSSKGLYKCYIEGNKIVWGNRDGRWQNSPHDGFLTFSASGDILTITETYSDGSSSTKSYIKALLSKHISVSN